MVGKIKIICVSTSGFEAGQCPAKTKMASGLVKLTGSGLYANDDVTIGT